MSPPQRYQPGLHFIALLTACATFPLIFLGGLVTSNHAGLSVPDWPNSYGYNMFLFPPRLWVGGIFFEHLHRLMASGVGFLSVVLTIWAWTTSARRSIRWLTIVVLAMVIIQGVLGGLRVLLLNVNLAIVHACFAQACFCVAALVVVVTSRRWIAAPDLSQSPQSSIGNRLIKFGIVAVGVIYLQLVVGAVMRHYQAGLAIPDFPLNYGKILPPMNSRELLAANVFRMHSNDPTIASRVSMGQIWIHFAHRCGAVLVCAAVLTLVIEVIRTQRRIFWLLAPALTLLGLLITQVMLGILTVLLRKPADVASAHVAVGALTLMTAFVLTVRAVRIYHGRSDDLPEPRFEVIHASANQGLDASGPNTERPTVLKV